MASMFRPASVEVVPRENGSFVVRSTRRLGAHPASVGGLLARRAAERPGATFLAERVRDDWRTIAYAETYERARRIGAGMLELGLGPQTPVAILSGASIAHALVSLGAMYAGIPVAPISPAYSTDYADHGRLRFVLDALRPGLVFVDDASAYRDALAVVDAATPLLIERGDAPREGTLSLAHFGADASTERLERAHAGIASNDVAKILFTSGSTGEPKGVINTHGMLCANQQMMAEQWPFLLEHDPVLVDWLPWHHTFGGNHNFNLVLFHGGTLYIDAGRPVPGLFDRSVAALREHPPTVYFNVPRGHRLLVEALQADDAFARCFFSRLRVIGNAAAALPQNTWHALRELARRYGDEVAITGSWGMTETSPLVTAVHYPLENAADVGLPAPGTELLFVPIEHKYEVRVRGAQVTPGYWHRDDLTARAFDAEGFYLTGDAMRFADPNDVTKGLLFDGRIAENFKLSSGTWVDAGAVRLAFLASANALVDDVVVAGDNGDELGALLFIGARTRERYGGDDEALRHAVAVALAEYNATAGGSSHRIERAIVVDEPLSPVHGELTDKGSVNRRRVLERRADAVERLFARGGATTVVLPATPAGA